MKPMIALIATGVILLLIMLYFGNTSFEGTFENNVYQNSAQYNKNAPVIKDMEKLITNVSLIYQDNFKVTVLNFDDNIKEKYPEAFITKIEVTYPNKPDTMQVVQYKLDISSADVVESKLSAGLYNVIFYVLLDNKNEPLKVMKSVYVE